MTVCIAASSSTAVAPNHIVLCTDWLGSNALGASETLLKLRRIADDWWCLTSGNENEIASMVQILRKAFGSQQTIDETNVSELVRSALSVRKSEKISEIVGGRYGMTSAQFIEKGKDILPDLEYRNVWMDIRSTKLDARLILAGFVDGFPCIVETDQTGGVVLREEYSAIGEGAILAHATLLNRDYTDVIGFNNILYRVYEAKKASEAVRSVGSSTLIQVICSDGSVQDVSSDGYIELERLRKEYGPKPLPINIAGEFLVAETPDVSAKA